MRWKRTIWAALAATGLSWGTARGGVEWGGALDPGREQHLSLTMGAVLEFEGLVTETTRRLYDVTGATASQSDAESYNLSDFNLDGPYGTIGLSFDSAWKWFRLQIDTSFMNPDTKATARRDYYLSVGEEIEYGGQSYDRLLIPEGTEFEAEFFGNLTELTMQFVPVGFRIGDGLCINPSIGLGVLVFGGQYDIDAGETTGVVQYQNPPENFARGGQSSGFLVMGAPQWGPGVEVRMGGSEGWALDLEVQYLLSQYDGSTAILTSADHREKNLEFDHRNLRFRGQIEFPTGKRALTLGVQVQMVDTEGTVTSTATDPDEILELRERFDKEFTFSLQSVLLTLGIAF